MESQEKPKVWTSWDNPVADPERWQEIRRAVEAGMSQKEASDVFRVSYDAIRQRAAREEWITEKRLAAMKAERVTSESQQLASESKRPETALQALTESMEGYKSRTILGLAKLAEKGVSRAVSADLPVENWQDAKIAAEIAMKLHQVGQESVQVNICNAFADMGEGAVIETEAEVVGDDEGEEGGRDSYFIDS